MDGVHRPAGGQLPDLLVRALALHRVERTLLGDEMAGEADEVGEAGEGPRDHHLGRPAGQLGGKTDDQGAEPVGDLYTPDDVGASLLRLLGIDHHKEYHTPDGRPVLIVRDGEPIRELVG